MSREVDQRTEAQRLFSATAEKGTDLSERQQIELLKAFGEIRYSKDWPKLITWAALFHDEDHDKSPFLFYSSHHGHLSREAQGGSSVSPERSKDAPKKDGELELLRRERDEFFTQVQNLQTRVVELRRTAARETQRYDQLLVQFDKVRIQNEKFLDCLNERNKTNDDLVHCLISRNDCRLRMLEKYEGIVDHVSADRASVVYEVKDDLVEQTYESSQFLNSRLPDEGTRLVVFVVVAEVDSKPIESEIKEIMVRDKHSSESITGPIEF